MVLIDNGALEKPSLPFPRTINSLDKLLELEPPIFEAAGIYQLTRQLLSAVCELHAQGLVHGSIQADKVLMQDAGGDDQRPVWKLEELSSDEKGKFGTDKGRDCEELAQLIGGVWEGSLGQAPEEWTALLQQIGKSGNGDLSGVILSLEALRRGEPGRTDQSPAGEEISGEEEELGEAAAESGFVARPTTEVVIDTIPAASAVVSNAAQAPGQASRARVHRLHYQYRHTVESRVTGIADTPSGKLVVAGNLGQVYCIEGCTGSNQSAISVRPMPTNLNSEDVTFVDVFEQADRAWVTAGTMGGNWLVWSQNQVGAWTEVNNAVLHETPVLTGQFLPGLGAEFVLAGSMGASSQHVCWRWRAIGEREEPVGIAGHEHSVLWIRALPMDEGTLLLTLMNGQLHGAFWPNSAETPNPSVPLGVTGAGFQENCMDVGIRSRMIAGVDENNILRALRLGQDSQWSALQFQSYQCAIVADVSVISCNQEFPVIAVGKRDGVIEIWDAAGDSIVLRQSFRGRNDAVELTALRFLSEGDGVLLAVGYEDGMIQVWEA